MLAQQEADLVSPSLCWGLPEVPGVGRLCHHHHCHSPSYSGDRAEVHIKMGMKGLSWPQSKELQWEGKLSLNEDNLLWIMAMRQLIHTIYSKHTPFTCAHFYSHSVPVSLSMFVCPSVYILTTRGKAWSCTHLYIYNETAPQTTASKIAFRVESTHLTSKCCKKYLKPKNA